MSAPGDPHVPNRWSRRDTLRAAWSACAIGALTEACSPATTTDTTTTSNPAAAQPKAPPTTTAQTTIAATAQTPHPPNGVALTFHGDGPPALATALLSEAERANAQLTVLAVGRWLGQYPELARRVLDGGHELGNHTEHHINIDTLSPAAAYAEIENCAVRLQRLTGSRGRWFRPSQAQHATATVRAAAVRAGYPTVLSYDLDSLDYTDPGTEAITHNVLSVVRAGDVVSMHLGHSGTVQALPAILDGLRTRGLQAVTASALFPQAVSAPEVERR